MRDPAVPRGRKVALAGGIVYLLLPIDLIPGIIPVAGQLDDLAALLLGIRHALRGCSPEVAQAHLRRADLTESALDADLRTVGVAGAWLLDRAAAAGRKALALSWRLLQGGLRRAALPR